MKAHSKIKGIFYRNIIIEDESGMDFIQTKKQMLLSAFAAQLRQIAESKISVKALA